MSDETHLKINSRLSIPFAELHYRFTPSSGPGGQHANRSATRVELLFDIANSPSLSEAQRQRLMTALQPHIDSAGRLRMISQASRSQVQNRQEVTARFQHLLAQALVPRKKRKHTRVPHTERERRREKKRRQSEKKRLRKPISGE